MQRLYKYHRLIDSGELHSTLYFVLNVGVSNCANLCHLSVNKSVVLKYQSEVEHVAIDLDDVNSGVIITNPITSYCI